ncbi:hypothetical protein E0H35_20105 [Rhizobium leguminosarum bv. viciae]|nr:hypothetical protein [Rhizobium leguminosarum bv. viciae]TBY96808.1 hypothetical protein E0H35_20105 [Rhizobium leguminosarum bv. viciae]
MLLPLWAKAIRRSSGEIRQRPKSDRIAPKVRALIAGVRIYPWIARDLAISETTVAAIVKRNQRAMRDAD